jgi:haloalkane dehalogenase
MRALRTPDDRFVGLDGFDFAPHYLEVDDTEGGRLRVHYLDEGPQEADPVLLMHGEPSWCYLYRTVIPPLVAAGHRVVCPDLVGFGRSDKPTEGKDHTYARHVRWMSEAILDVLDLRRITFFGQDWGGLIGLRLVAAAPDRFARVVIGNTGLPRGDGRLSEAFLAWQRFSRETPRFDVGKIVAGGCTRALLASEMAAYDAPFPTDEHKAGARTMPSLVPTTPDDPEAAANAAAWESLSSFDKPFLCAFSDADRVTAGGEAVFIREVPGARGVDHVTVRGAGHFLQEDAGPELARIIAGFIDATPLAR